MVKYGFIGIGIMGRGMAMNLVKKGFDVTVGAPCPACSLPRRCATEHGARAPLRTAWDAQPRRARLRFSAVQGCFGASRAARRAHAVGVLHAPAWKQVWNRSADKCKDLVDGMRACALTRCVEMCVPMLEGMLSAPQRLLVANHTLWSAGHVPSPPSFRTAQLAQSKWRRRGSASSRATSPLRASRRQTCARTSSLEPTASSRAWAPARATSTAALSTRRAPKRSGCATYPRCVRAGQHTTRTGARTCVRARTHTHACTAQPDRGGVNPCAGRRRPLSRPGGAF